jgi:hypothetical protein
MELVLASPESAWKSEKLELVEEFPLVRLSTRRLGLKKTEPMRHLK